MNDPLDRYLHCLETLGPGNVDELLSLCDPAIHFRDPFNDTHGSEPFGKIMRDVFAQIDGVRFTVTNRAWTSASRTHALAQWTMSGRLRALRNAPWSVDGCTALEFTADGRVSAHHDYWDAAGGLYERIPFLGRVLALLRRRLRVT